jgi:hypothetical protein
MLVAIAPFIATMLVLKTEEEESAVIFLRLLKAIAPPIL